MEAALKERKLDREPDLNGNSTIFMYVKIVKNARDIKERRKLDHELGSYGGLIYLLIYLYCFRTPFPSRMAIVTSQTTYCFAQIA